MNVYDTRFDSNEWFVLAGLFIGAALVVILPKRFRAKNAIVYYTCGLYSGLFFDHSLGLEPVDFYDVNDSSHYEWTDFLSYVSFGCVSYIFFYVYDRIGVRPSGIAVYVLVCALLSTGMEWFAVKAHVFHYRHQLPARLLGSHLLDRPLVLARLVPLVREDRGRASAPATRLAHARNGRRGMRQAAFTNRHASSGEAREAPLSLCACRKAAVLLNGGFGFMLFRSLTGGVQARLLLEIDSAISLNRVPLPA